MTLKIDVFTKDLDLTDKIHDYTTKKVSRLQRFLNEIGDCRVDLAYAKTARNAADRFIAQITIRGKGFILRSEERADGIFARRGGDWSDGSGSGRTARATGADRGRPGRRRAAVPCASASAPRHTVRAAQG